MTEITDKKKLPPAVQRFILHWGDMGDGWGVNRSVSQIHGLLYLAEAPMTAEDIADTLGMALGETPPDRKRQASPIGVRQQCVEAVVVEQDVAGKVGRWKS